MYWPLGAPQVYAATKCRRKNTTASDGQEGDDEQVTAEEAPAILGLRVSRNGQFIATLTATTLIIWQSSPVLILATVTRSIQSLEQYGHNVSVLLRPDSSIAVVQTVKGYLVTYSISTDPQSRIYQQVHEAGQTRRQSNTDQLAAEEEQRGVREVNVRFRMVIKIDAGIGKALALDDELVVATEKPAAVQCIKWAPDSAGAQTSTELLSRMTWIQKRSIVKDMIFDRAMSLAIWLSSDGTGYAVQRITGTPKDTDVSRKLFRGYGFHQPSFSGQWAIKGAINARFSLLAIGCANAEIRVYTARDYAGNIPLSHMLEPPASLANTGIITSLAYSPDGYCLFASYEKGWSMWSVYGKPGANSFTADHNISDANAEGWLRGVSQGVWLHAGLGLILSSPGDDRLWLLEMARSAVTGCFCAANVSRTVLMADSGLLIYRGYDLPLLTTISADTSLWHHVKIPSSYLATQRPIRSVVISQDGRYLAVAGRRGLAHYSISSGRWKTFEDTIAENAFVVRAGMCWYQHILIAAAETDEHHELRLYSRERRLEATSLMYTERLPSPVVVITLTGQDSLLAYTYDNVLYHYVVNASGTTVSLVQVGQIALHGIIRAPARVRAVSWILPENQLRDGDPSHDVAKASVIFLVDAKLVLLQPSTNDEGALKYDMRVIANHVEYFDLMRDQISLLGAPSQSPSQSPDIQRNDALHSERGLRDSLWYFDGSHVQCWTDVEDLLKSALTENDRDLPHPVAISTDFYPSSIALSRGILVGIDADLVQRRDVHFAYFRFSIRTQLFLPPMLRQYLSSFDSAAASGLSHRYQQLPYFSHALEILLHTVLDDEVDVPPSPEDALLPSVLSFLSSFPEYLDILVQCIRKTEVRSWRTLFAHLPPAQELFEVSLERNLLKTAGGYLLVLHTFEPLESSSTQCVRLLQRAKEVNDWELSKELARFLLALDTSGDTLRNALAEIGLPLSTNKDADSEDSVRLKTPIPQQSRGWKRYSINVGMNGQFGNTTIPAVGGGGRSPRSLATAAEERISESEGGYFAERE